LLIACFSTVKTHPVISVTKTLKLGAMKQLLKSISSISKACGRLSLLRRFSLHVWQILYGRNAFISQALHENINVTILQRWRKYRYRSLEEIQRDADAWIQ
jgi:hypothetical protein